MLNTSSADGVVRHVEIKAFLDDYHSVCNQVAALATAAPSNRVQHDIFFHCRSGRLKLRSSGKFHDLIYYRRKDDYGPTESFYQTARTKNPAALQSSLNSAFGELGRVKKFRRSYQVGVSTIHIDRVGGLGDFIEIKTELNHGLDGCSDSSRCSISAEKGAKIVEGLMTTLDVDLFQLVDGAYVDLINERASPTVLDY